MCTRTSRSPDIGSRRPSRCILATGLSRRYKGGGSDPGTTRVPSTTKPRSLAVVVLAAGKGKRLKSKLPKVLHPVCGRPSLWHVLVAAKAARPQRLIVVVSHGSEQVAEAVHSGGCHRSPCS